MKFYNSFCLKNSLVCMAVFVSLASACTTKSNEISQSKEKVSIMVDRIASSFSCKDMIDSISFVSLDLSSPNALFKNIDKCIVHNERVYILDYLGTSSVKVFGINGDFLFNVGTQGIAPMEYYKVTDFDVTDEGIFLLDSKMEKILKYDFDGLLKTSFIYKGKVKGVNSFAVVKGTDFLLGMDNNLNDKEQIILTDEEFKVKKKILQFSSHATKSHLSIGNFERCGERLVYNYPISNDIYIFNDEGEVVNTYEISFDKDVPQDIISDYLKVSKARKHGTSLSYLLETPFLCGNHLLSNLYYNSNKAVLCINIRDEKKCLKEYKMDNLSISIDDFNFPIYADDKIVVCMLDMMFYDYMDDASKNVIDKKKLSDLENGGNLLVIYHLK